MSKPIPKTDETRWQNIRDLDALLGQPCDVTLKIDGSSLTAFCVLPGDHPGDAPVVGLCSRGQELKLDIEGTNPWLEAAQQTEVLNKLRDFCVAHGVSLALRGEVYGVGCQSSKINPHCKEPRGVAFYSVWNIREHRYEGRDSDLYFLRLCQYLGIPAVPVIEEDVLLTRELLLHYDREVEIVGGQPFEGVVIKLADTSFKVINKFYDERK